MLFMNVLHKHKNMECELNDWTDWKHKYNEKGPPLAKKEKKGGKQQKQTNEVKGVEFKQFSLEGKRSLLLPAANPLWNASASNSRISN